MKNLIIKTAVSVGVVALAIILTGLFLDEASRGTLGGFVKGIAKKATNGYGALAA
jgi:hypothetical protein